MPELGLICPLCAYDGSDVEHPFKYLEDVVCWRPVLATLDNKLLVDGLYQTGEGYDDGTNPRLMCGRCLGDFPIPAELGVDFQ